MEEQISEIVEDCIVDDANESLSMETEVDSLDNVNDEINGKLEGDGHSSSNVNSPFDVKLDAFEGPLDLLLHLIKENKIDIFDIPISFITEKYLAYIKAMKELDLDVSGEFIVMAATLLYIKSKMLLPIDEVEEEEDEGIDPRDELVQKLLEYQSFKKVAQELGFLATERQKVYNRPKNAKIEIAEEPIEDVEFHADLYSLIQAFSVVLRKKKKETIHEVFEEVVSVEEKMEEITSILNVKKKVSFMALFDGQVSRNLLIASFFAILELTKQRAILISQNDVFGDIFIVKKESPDNNETIESN